ncbi:hypothetical protein AHF37_09219 [Paragonimus kellicotti]|nr:hypothetical protein AHF37_09219 [Paragonimus kellicotti]
MDEDSIVAMVMEQSRHEYLESLRKKRMSPSFDSQDLLSQSLSWLPKCKRIIGCTNWFVCGQWTFLRLNNIKVSPQPPYRGATSALRCLDRLIIPGRL